MRRPKAIAIAIKQKPHFIHTVLDFMYGTPERTRYTYAFAFALLIIGLSMSAGAQPYCSLDTLPVN